MKKKTRRDFSKPLGLFPIRREYPCANMRSSVYIPGSLESSIQNGDPTPEEYSDVILTDDGFVMISVKD